MQQFPFRNFCCKPLHSQSHTHLSNLSPDITYTMSPSRPHTQPTLIVVRDFVCVCVCCCCCCFYSSVEYILAELTLPGADIYLCKLPLFRIGAPLFHIWCYPCLLLIQTLADSDVGSSDGIPVIHGARLSSQILMSAIRLQPLWSESQWVRVLSLP